MISSAEFILTFGQWSRTGSCLSEVNGTRRLWNNQKCNQQWLRYSTLCFRADERGTVRISVEVTGHRWCDSSEGATWGVDWLTETSFPWGGLSAAVRELGLWTEMLVTFPAVPVLAVWLQQLGQPFWALVFSVSSCECSMLHGTRAGDCCVNYCFLCAS